MSVEIQYSRAAIELGKSQLKQGLDEYSSCELLPFGTVIPVSGSSEHDATLGTLLKSALLSFKEVVYADVGLFESAGQAFEEADESCARAMAAR